MLMYEIVALAASAGGLHALSQVLSGLPVEFPAPLVVVQHLNPHYHSRIPEILNRYTPLWVKEAELGERLVAGRVYLAPPNYHLLVNADRTLSFTQTEFVNFVRPCADLLFESVANTYQNRAIAVVLTGKGVDGTQACKRLKTMVASPSPRTKQLPTRLECPDPRSTLGRSILSSLYQKSRSP